MKVRVQKKFGDFAVVSETTLLDMLRDLSPQDSLLVKLPCDHRNASIDHGVKRCVTCGDYMEVTSYRD